jgi:hypothetical protein
MIFRHALAVFMLFCAFNSNAQECQRPIAPDIAGGRYIALQKRAAYATFIADECGFENDLQKKYRALVNMAFEDSVKSQQQGMDDFMAKKKEFSNDANLLGIGKRCLIESGKTRVFISEVSDDIAAYIAILTRYKTQVGEWNSCQAQQQAVANAQAYRQFEESAKRKAVADIEAGFRNSLAKPDTYVLMLKNVSNQPANFQLRCYQTNGMNRIFSIAILPGNSTEIGFLEGWYGNFVPGEYCQAFYKDEQIWQVNR